MKNFNEALHRLVDAALLEDVGEGDHTSLSCIAAGVTGKAALKVKQAGVLAGVDVARAIFFHKEPTCRFVALIADGQMVDPGLVAFEATATMHTILKCERVLLNCMQRMSGIATLTRKYAEQLNGYKTKILDTRKTTPNFRLLEKEAVRIGGGLNHRFGLYDMILLKDNHIDYCGGLEKAIENAHDYVQLFKPGLKIEVEARTIGDVKRIVAAGRGKVQRVMFDNFTPAQIEEALTWVNGEFETEASGGIHLGNIRDFAKTGVDFISVGALVHQAKSLDLSLKAIVL